MYGLDLYSCVLYGLDFYDFVLRGLTTAWIGYLRIILPYIELLSIQLTFVLPCMGLESSVGEPCRFDTVPVSVQFRTSYFFRTIPPPVPFKILRIFIINISFTQILLKLYGNSMVLT